MKTHKHSDMPNHIETTLTITGPKEHRDRLLAYGKGTEQPFACNTILPMPAALRDIHSGSCHIDGQKVDIWREVVQADGTRETVTVSEEERATLRELYDADNWYDWSIKTWGTKWDVY